MTDVNEILKSRKDHHGDFRVNARIMCDTLRAWGILPEGLKFNGHLVSDVQIASLIYQAGKVSRIIGGDPNFPDHWFDSAGYPTLVGNILEADAKKKQEEDDFNRPAGELE